MAAVPPAEPTSAFAGTEPTAISSRQLVAWCQAQGYTPQRMQPRSSAGSAGAPTPAAPHADRPPTGGNVLAVCHRCGASAHATGLCDIMTPLTWSVAATGLPGISRAALVTPDADADAEAAMTATSSSADPVVQAVAAVADAVASRPLAKRRRLYDHELDSRSPASAVWAAPARRRPVNAAATNDGGDMDDDDDELDVDIDVDDSANETVAPSVAPATSSGTARSVPSIPSAPSAPSVSAASSLPLHRWSLAQRAAAVSLRPLGAASSMPSSSSPVMTAPAWPTGKGAAVASLSAEALEALWQVRSPQRPCAVAAPKLTRGGVFARGGAQSGMRFAAALVRQSVLQVPIAAAVTASADEPAVAAAFVPAHVWRAVASLPEADFLTQQYMAPKL